MNKRGGITTLILIAISIPVVFIFYQYLFPWLQSVIAGNTCRASVIAAASTGGSLDLECPTEDIAISQNEIETGTAQRKVSDNMRRCWTDFGEGKLDPLKKRVFDFGDVACHRCGKITFDSSVRPATIGMAEILDTELSVRDTTLKQLLYSGKETPDDFYPDNLSTSKTYYVNLVMCSESITDELGYVPLSCDTDEAAVWVVEAQEYEDVARRRCDYEF